MEMNIIHFTFPYDTLWIEYLCYHIYIYTVKMWYCSLPGPAGSLGISLLNFLIIFSWVYWVHHSSLPFYFCYIYFILAVKTDENFYLMPVIVLFSPPIVRKYQRDNSVSTYTSCQTMTISLTQIIHGFLHLIICILFHLLKY